MVVVVEQPGVDVPFAQRGLDGGQVHEQTSIVNKVGDFGRIADVLRCGGRTATICDPGAKRQPTPLKSASSLFPAASHRRCAEPVAVPAGESSSNTVQCVLA